MASDLSRRHFLAGSTSLLGATSALGSFAAHKAQAANTTGYKAIVCLFLFGGLDHADTVIPTDEASFNQLAAARPNIFDGYDVGSGTSSRDRDNLLALNPDNASAFGTRQFGLPREMMGLHQLFEAGDAAIVGNVGPLLEPITRETFQDRSGRRPPRLFSHNDQQSTWLALEAEGANIGWGGRFADAILAADTISNPLYSAVGISSSSVFLSGETARQFRPPEKSTGDGVNIIDESKILGTNSRYAVTRDAFGNIIRQTDFNHNNIMRADYSVLSGQAIANAKQFNEALELSQPILTPFPSTRLGNNLRRIAEIIDTRTTLNTSRQVFFLSLGGFDTHSRQTAVLPALQQHISDALLAFRNAMIEIGAWQNVAVFTGSDFGRTLTGNGDGTDHGWGGHHFVMGGDVVGKRIYGDIPPPDRDHEQYTPSRGRLIPSVSVEQYAATIGKWFGLSPAELAVALPNLSEFSTSDLGFLG